LKVNDRVLFNRKKLKLIRVVSIICQVGIVSMVLIRVIFTEMNSMWDQITLYTLGGMVLIGMISQILKKNKGKYS
jgi:hypothetical protein